MKEDYIEYVNKLSLDKKMAGCHKTAQNYEVALRSFCRYVSEFLHRESVMFVEITSELMSAYEKYLISVCRIRRNTSSAYLRTLRAAYNNAVEDGLCKDRAPFRKVYTGTDKTRKRSLTDGALRSLFSVSLPDVGNLSQARDIFCFSFLAQGMPFVDLVTLRYSDFATGKTVLVYTRSKTGETINVKVTQLMRQIVEKYHDSGDKYAFSIGIDHSDHKSYETALRRYNRHLRKLAQMANIDHVLSSYCARHTWASQAFSRSVPLSVISKCMGHTSEKTTRIYLASLNDSETHPLLSNMTLEYESMIKLT